MKNEFNEVFDHVNAANDDAEAVHEATAATAASGEETAEQGEISGGGEESVKAELVEPGSFEKMGLDKKLLRAIGDMGFDSATPIQERAIPI